MTDKSYVLKGVVLEEEMEFTLVDLSRACSVHAEWIIALVDEGILEPSGNDVTEWRFSGDNLKRVLAVQHLQKDLGVNLAGSALVLELLEEIEALRARVAALEGLHER
ncbi:chaperone modulator CbpM [Methylomarinum sp. Ch1-1]|uniref:Chaperone modulator CbpM n=1 Tax=Methylomarinum roseum TaxID=3067653 RepID=A0AAU7NWD2_9GAMM|nr:chaperone modulator CbpM [Methylomarinum sp. Ch1-1]MDP4522607.1 chaperone modulator CbpM [Methylomarinum sp. Ch1-1]